MKRARTEECAGRYQAERAMQDERAMQERRRVIQASTLMPSA
jgi:hypothetical protein